VPRSLRYLRIAFSTVCGVVCVLLIVLWVRTYFGLSAWESGPGPASDAELLIGRGEIVALISWPPRSTAVHWNILSDPKTEWIYHATRYKTVLGFWVTKFPSGYYRDYCLIVPLWFLVILSAVLAAMSWMPWLRWRFGLRSLLITKDEASAAESASTIERIERLRRLTEEAIGELGPGEK
jgi:hypothetical protein